VFEHHRGGETLEQHIIETAEVKAYKHHYGEKVEVAPVNADISIFDGVEVQAGDEFDLTVYHVINSSRAITGEDVTVNGTNGLEGTDHVKEQIKIIIFDDKDDFVAGLPVTGEQAKELMTLSGSVTMISFIILMMIRNQRKRQQN